jgi:Flp pilus assembly protein TadG
MMQAFKNSSWREKAQSMVEFALVFPVLLLLLYGIIEFGRLLFIYTSVTTSSREAARYGSAVGDIGGVPRYLDCNGIANAARRSAIINAINVDDGFTITYDHGTTDTQFAGTCAAAQNMKFTLGDRIRVVVTVDYAPLVPLVNFASFPITSSTARTILTSVEVQGTPAPDKPYIYFETLTQSGTETELDNEVKTVYAVLSYADTSDITAFFIFSGTATKGVDYTFADSVTFAAGQKRLAVARVVNDPYDEYAETLDITILQATGAIIDEGRKHHVTTILDSDTDDPPPTVQFRDATQTVLEDDAVFPIVTLSELSGKDITVPYTTTGTAEYNLDYTLNPAGFSFNFPAMSGPTQQVTFMATKDDLDEEDFEDAILTLGVPTNATLGTPISDDVRIQDIDEPPFISFELESQKVVEGIPGKVKVRLDKITTKVVTVGFTVTDAAVYGATKNVDYTVTTVINPLTILPGSLEAEIAFNIAAENPDLVEPDENFVIELNAPSNATLKDPWQHIVTIAGIGVPPIVNFEASKSASEGDGAVQIQILLDHTWSLPVTVPYSISGGTAVNGTDYTAAAGSVTIPVGSLYSTFTVNLIEDTLDEDNETIIFSMGTPTNATKPDPSPQHVLTIADNDEAPLVNFELPSQIGMENGGPMTARIRLSAVSTKPVTIPFTVGLPPPTQGSDYTITASPVTIPAGSLFVDVVITVIDDTIPGEGNETVVITLGSPTNAKVGPQDSHRATIKDNEVCPSFYEKQWNASAKYFTVLLSYTDLTQPLIYIDKLSIDWDNSGGQNLQKIYWNNNLIFDGNASQDPLNFNPPELFDGDPSYRNYSPGAAPAPLRVEFKKELGGAITDYNVTITFNNGCSIP